MKKLFWLNSSTSSQAKASSAAVFKVKADEGEQEEAAAGEKPVRFPICTALSPSSKAKALAAKMGHNPEQKRLSLDSGYADSNQCSPRLVLCGFYVNLLLLHIAAALYANTTASDKIAV